jgi:hypothetical protein
MALALLDASGRSTGGSPQDVGPSPRGRACGARRRLRRPRPRPARGRGPLPARGRHAAGGDLRGAVGPVGGRRPGMDQRPPQRPRARDRRVRRRRREPATGRRRPADSGHRHARRHCDPARLGALCTLARPRRSRLAGALGPGGRHRRRSRRGGSGDEYARFGFVGPRLCRGGAAGRQRSGRPARALPAAASARPPGARLVLAGPAAYGDPDLKRRLGVDLVCTHITQVLQLLDLRRQ